MDATDVEANDLTTIGRDRGGDIENDLIFLGLEWIALDDDPANALLASPELAPYAHKLRVEREEKPYVLSEPEEQALNARRPGRLVLAGAARPARCRRSRCRSTAARACGRTRSASSCRASTAATARSTQAR